MKQRDSSQRPVVVIPYVENVSEAVVKITRTVLTRRVSSYGLPAWVSSELGPMGVGAQPLQRPQQHWNWVTTK